MKSFNFDITLPFPILILGFLFILIIILVGGLLLYKYFETRSNNALKQSMLDRGMSSQEIEQVMNAGPKLE